MSYRPHFSLDIRTTSSEGLLLHISGAHGVPLVILYLDDGKVKLSVGTDKVISSQKISDGDWHNVCSKKPKWCIFIIAKPLVLFHVVCVCTDQVQSKETQISFNCGWCSNTLWTAVERIHT